MKNVFTSTASLYKLPINLNELHQDILILSLMLFVFIIAN